MISKLSATPTILQLLHTYLSRLCLHNNRKLFQLELNIFWTYFLDPYEFSLTKSSSIEMVRILFNGFMFSLIGMTEWSQQTH